MDTESVVEQLRLAGCVAAEEEAVLLIAAAGRDPDRLASLVDRRCSGEPLAWLVGWVRFCDETIVVRPGVYVPRWQTEPLALEAAARLPDGGTAVDLCTGAGAIAVVLARRRSSALVIGTELDPVAAACAAANGVEVLLGDLTAPLPPELAGQVDVVTAVVPYVPTDALHLLPRDVLAFEPRQALDGGKHGMRLLARTVVEAAPLLRPGGSLLLEVGAGQVEVLEPTLIAHGYDDLRTLVDAEGDPRGLSAVHR